MPNPFTLQWSQNGSVVHGYAEGAYVDGGLAFPVTFPGFTSGPLTVNLQSSAQDNGTFDILKNIKFYLVGDTADLVIVQGSWPNLGLAYNPPRPELNGGLQISFDGTNWATFSIANTSLSGSVGLGDQNDPTTWLTLPALAIGADATDGVLGPFDIATIQLRYLVPSTATANQVFDIQLAVSCDIE